MTFKEKVLAALDELEVTPESIAGQLSVAIKGQTITERFDKAGKLTGRIVKQTPEDALKGAMLFDALNGGELGLAPRSTSFRKPTEIAHKRMSIDNRIIVSPEDEPDE